MIAASAHTTVRTFDMDDNTDAGTPDPGTGVTEGGTLTTGRGEK